MAARNKIDQKSLVIAAKGVQARKVGTSAQKTPKRAQRAVIRPTEQRLARNDHRSAGLATKFDAPIDKLLAHDHLTQEQYDALKVYAEQARLAEQSTMRDSCDFSVRGGSGNGPSAAIISARIQTSLMENRAGALVSILRAVVRDERSITDYCIEKHGARERYDKRGRFVAMVPKCERRVVPEAREQLKKVAQLIVR